MTLEQRLTQAIQDANLNIDYNGETITNSWGHEYSIRFKEPKNSLDFSYTDFVEKEIVLKEPHNSSNQELENLAQTLAHEIGHTEIYLPSTALTLSIGIFGTALAMKNKCSRTFGYTAMIALGYKMFVEELFAEVAAYKLHDADFQYYITSAKLMHFAELCNLINSLF